MTSITQPFLVPDYTAPFRTKERSHTMLNRNQLEMANDFFPAPSTSNKQTRKTYLSLDPRLMDPMRGTIYPLDRPPYETRYNEGERNVYSDMGRPVREQTYASYEDINGGQVSYYTDKQFEEPYFSPLFQLRTEVTPFIFQDPMGALKPQYVRRPAASPQYISDYRHDQDEIYFREDIMSGYMQKRNQTSYALLHNNNLPIAYDPDDGLPEHLLF